MKSTGIVRKIDELGRLVIPKEIRKSLNIHSGEDIEFFIEEDKVILTKYQKMLSIKETTQKYIDIITKITTNKIYITDKENIISSSLKEDINQKIDIKIIDNMTERKTEIGRNIKIGNKTYDEYYIIKPIIIDADAVGTIIIIKEKDINDEDKTIINILNILIQDLIY